MNKKAWWLKIKNTSPKALAQCRASFESRHPETWRQQMQQPSNLISYFQDCGIRIDIRPSYRKYNYPIFGYKVYGPSTTIQQDASFTKRELAVFDALEFAFSIWEKELAKERFKTGYHKKMRRRKAMEKGEREAWGQASRKKE